MTFKNRTLFEKSSSQMRPLADRLRPKTVEEVIGQVHLLGEGKPLGLLLKVKKLPSMILWGPPGCGKTTLAKLLAKDLGIHFAEVSAVVGGVADLRKVFESAKAFKVMGQDTLLFVDEIHRFNRAQQDVFLSFIEDGTLILIGATTENPSFALNAALLSRCRVLTLNRLTSNDLDALLKRAENLESKTLPLSTGARQLLISLADGDGRMVLNFAEILFLYNANEALDEAQLMDIIQRRAPLYDKGQESHYNLISALHKAVRGSDPDASLYWFCRMIDGGEDMMFIARRLVRMAVEDVGLADPNALTHALASKDAYVFQGSPEGELALAQTVIYLALAPKSNAAYVAYKKAMAWAKEMGSLPPPKHILNAPTRLMKDLGYGSEYIYDHDTEEGFSGQDYFPEGVERPWFYIPKGQGFEENLKKHALNLEKMRKEIKERDSKA
jgi:putative ATPase